MPTQHKPSTARELIELLDREKVRSRLFGGPAGSNAPGHKAIGQAMWKGELPSSWYRVIECMCRASGLECPKDLFSFREDATADQKNGLERAQ
ncbi:hypothetical protein PXK20_05475 [Phaeobacter gallaeciensis]|nr:hypothetical protein [Phaeobacter gallaeciensis]